ncbi:ABC transporter permease, partial [Streptomyces anulatus]|uniref:ABC transporter permease n=1 Tax=Streptomyces anulatus TaxID=1892 RepID=UPI0034483ACF
ARVTDPAVPRAVRVPGRRLGPALLVLGRRLGLAGLVLWGAVTVAFSAVRLMPGDTADILAGLTRTTPALRAQIVREYQLDRPLPLQYLGYLGRLLRGDLGDSYVLRIPVARAIGQQLGATLDLLAATVLLTVSVSLFVGLLTAHRGSRLRGPLTFAETLGAAVPPFWLGILLLTLLSFRLHWFPAVGTTGPRGLVLPAVTLAAAPTVMITQVLRRGLERALDEPFVVTARARGIGEAAVRVRHVLRHALIPVTTLTGWLAGSLIGGAVVVESVFSRQGLGRLVVNAVTNKDMPLVIGVVLVSALVYVAVNTAVDLLYPLIDPRLRA